MYSRILMSTLFALLATATLLLTMDLLIRLTSTAAAEERQRYELAFVRVPPEETVHEKETRPEPISDPVEPPPTRRDPIDNSGEETIFVSEFPQRPAGPATPDTLLPAPDGGATPIVRVEPTYPARMAAAGIEGHVIVAFDVMPNGTVANVRVLDSSHKGFERAAIRAALRFKYKARVVDGQPVTAHNVQTMFTFHMKD